MKRILAAAALFVALASPAFAQTQIPGGGGGGVTSVTCGGTTITTSGNCGALTGDVTAAAGSGVTTLANIPAISGANLTSLNASNIGSGTLAAARGGAGTITGALKGNGAGVVSQAACADLSNGATGCSTATGTSGATVPLNSTANTFALGQTMASAAINGTGGAGYVEFGPQSAQPSTPAANTFRIFANASGKFTWIGANGFLRVFDGTANTADRTYTLPDVTGTMTVLGNASTGSGSVVLATSPTLVTPTLGAATGTSLALGGATIGTDALGVTGTSTFTGNLSIAGSSNGLIFSAGPATTGLYWNAATSSVRFQSNGDRYAFTQSSLNIPALGMGGLSSPDVILTRAAAATLQHGAADVDTAPVAQTIRTQGALAGGTSNVAGANLTVIVSPGKGTGAGGSLIVQTAPAGSTGTAVNAAATALTIDSTKTATFNGNILPAAAGSTNLGSASFGFGNLYASVANLTSVDGGASGGYLRFGTGAGQFRFGNQAESNTFTLSVPTTAQVVIGKAANATPVANTLTIGESSRSGTDTNVAGANGTIQSGNGTGDAAVSGVTIQAPTAVASGTGAQTQTNVAVFKTTGVTITPGIIAGGSPPTLTGTCTTGSQVGGNTAGSFAATCTAQTVIITFATTAPNGWVCDASDETTSADSLKQTSHTTTSCTLTGTTVAADVVVWHANAF